MASLVIPFSLFFKDTATTEIYTLSLHDALPIYGRRIFPGGVERAGQFFQTLAPQYRTEEHTSELQSPCNIVCRLLHEKKDTLYPALPRLEMQGLVTATRKVSERN